MNERTSEEMLLDFDGWQGRQPEDVQEAIRRHLDLAPEGERDARKRTLADIYAVAEDGRKDPGAVGEQWEIARRGYAEGLGGEWAAVKDDPAAFHGLVVKRATQRKDERLLLSGTDAGDKPEDKQTLASHAFNAAVVGKPVASAYVGWHKEASRKTGYDPARSDTYLKGATDLHAKTVERFAPVLPLAREAFAALSKDTDWETFSETLAPRFEALPEAQKKDFRAALRAMADDAPDEMRSTFLGNLGKATGRVAGIRAVADVASFYRNAYGLAASLIVPGVDTGQQLSEIGTALAEHNLESDLRRVQEENYSPIRDTFPEGLQWIERGIYGAPQALATTATVLVPVVGMPTLFGIVTAQNYEAARFRLIDEGMDDATASSAALLMAPIAAVPEAALDRLGALALLGKVPMLSKALGAMGRKTGVAGFGVRALTGGAIELATERTQDLMLPVVEAAAAALNEDMPGVVWRNGKNGVLDGWWTRTGETLVALLPLALIGAAASGNRASVISQASDLELRAMGAKPADIAEFREKTEPVTVEGQPAELDPAPIEAAAEKLIANADGTSEEARSATAELQQELRAQAQADTEQLQADMTDAGLTDIVKTESGYAVKHEDGTLTEVGGGENVGPMVAQLAEATAEETMQEAVRKHGGILNAWEKLQEQIDNPETPEADRSRLRKAQRKMEGVMEDESRRSQMEEHAEETSATPMGPGKMTAGELPPQKTTSLKKAVVKQERLARGLEDLPKEQRQSVEATVQRAEDAVDSDPTLAPKLIARIVDVGDRAISQDDAAVLLVERNRVMNERRKWEEVEGRKELTPEEREAGMEASTPEEIAEASKQLEDIENQLNRLDLAQRRAGSTWGRTGVMYQQLIREDFTLEAMERRARKSKQGPLDAAERAKVAELSGQVERLLKEREELLKVMDEAVDQASASETYKAMVAEQEAKLAAQEKELAARPKFGREVFDIARGIVNNWKADADLARTSLRERLGRTSAGVDPTIVLDVARIVRAKIGEFGLDFAETSTAMIAEFGAEIQPYLKKAWVKAQELIHKQNVPPKAKQAIEGGALKPKKTEKKPVDFKARAKAEAAAGEGLSSKTVGQLAEAHIRAGVHGEDAVMKAVHADIKEFYPDVTERDVRRAFVDYGKAKFPNPDEVKKEMRELKTLVRLQESIDRETAGLSALHTGLQRDKATQSIREKQKQLNELLKKRKGPPSPEQLTGRDEARKTAIRNQIEDLDKQLRTGEKPAAGTPAPKSAETERLMAERDAMREKLREIEEEANPPKSEAERYNATRMKTVVKELAALEAQEAAGKYTPKPKRVPKVKDAALIAKEAELAEARGKAVKWLHELAMAQRTRGEKILGGIRQTKDAFVNIMASVDFSAPRQMLGAILANTTRLVTQPKTGARMLGNPMAKMFRSAFSEKQAREAEARRKRRPNAVSGAYEIAEIEFTELEATTFTKGEENARSVLDDWAARPIAGGGVLRGGVTAASRVVRGSNRAFITALNETRADLADELLRANFKDRAPTNEELKAIGNLVNIATGRGKLNPKLAGGAAKVLWSPKLLASRIQALSGQPFWGKAGRAGGLRAQAIVAKEYVRVIAGGFVLGAVALMFDDKKEKDPTSSDFGKIVRGKTRVDVWGGFQQVTTIVSRGIRGRVKTVEGKRRDISQYGIGNVAWDFAVNKIRPDIKAMVGVGVAVVDKAQGKKKKQVRVTPGEAALGLIPVPISIGNVKDLIEDRGFPEAMVLQMLNSFGVGVNVYTDEKEPVSRVRP